MWSQVRQLGLAKKSRGTLAGRCSAFVAVLLLTAAAAIAQTDPPPAGQSQTPPEQQPAAPAGEPGQEGADVQAPAVPAVPEGIEITEGSGFRYESKGRRDPFVSLALGVNILPPDVRPPGLAGMLIQEVSLRGIVKTVSGYIAMIQGTDNKSYFAREGERLYDGNIQSIDDGRVVFRQEINDPLRIEKFQQVEKNLHPVEEGKR
jgi:Tfp pilus assembly protein PilP